MIGFVPWVKSLNESFWEKYLGMGVDDIVRLCTQQHEITQCTSSQCSGDSLSQNISMHNHKKRHKKGLEQSQGENINGILKTKNILPVLYDGHSGWGEWWLPNARS